MDEKLQPLDLEATIVVRLEPVMAVALLLAGASFSILCAAGAWGLFGRGLDSQNWLMLAVSFVLVGGVLFFGLTVLVWGGLLATASQPVLVVTPMGVLDRRVSRRLIPWTSITGVVEAWNTGGIAHRMGARVTIDRELLKDLPPVWPVLPFDVRLRTITISAVATNIDARSLHTVVDAYWKAHRNKKEPINV